LHCPLNAEVWMRSRALGLAALAFLVGLCALIADSARPASAQQLDAGKPPHQIFSATCSACHRSPRGLVRNVSPGSLPGFLRQHYTTGSDMAGAMAAYVLSSGGTERVAEPPPKREPKQRAKSDSKSGQDVAARPAEAKEHSKSRRHKDAKKGKAEPAETSKEVEKQEPKHEPAKQEAAKPAHGESDKPAEPEKSTAPAEPPKTVECRIIAPAPPPREPVSQITLPGFPPPVVEPPPAPVTDPPGCDPYAAPARHSDAGPGATGQVSSTGQADTSASSEADAPKLDIMQDEPHSARQKRAE
jgi:hypothetical protein